jgi:hypothetical protein
MESWIIRSANLPASYRVMNGRDVSDTSMREIENLITELQKLRKTLQTNSNRIQQDITEHTELNQQVMRLTNIISESVKKLPVAPSMSP